jgi:hypothetical protein
VPFWIPEYVSALNTKSLDVEAYFFRFATLKDFVDVANVISRYLAAGIPLETMWTDIGMI